MPKIGDELALTSELQDAVARSQTADPDVTIARRYDRLQTGGPVRMMVCVTPGMHDVAVLIHGDDLRAGYAAHSS